MSEISQKQPEETGNIRDEQGRFVPGVSGNLEGRPPETIEQKLLKKAVKEFVAEYKQSLAESLPKLSSVLIAKALEGDITAIKEIHDRIMGKPITPIAAEVEHRLDFTDWIRQDSSTVYQKYGEQTDSGDDSKKEL